MPMKYVKIWGEFRTGTNWVTELIARNLPGVHPIQSMVQSKHDRNGFDRWLWERSLAPGVTEVRSMRGLMVPLDPKLRDELRAQIETMPHVVMWKDPYAWVVSMRWRVDPRYAGRCEGAPSIRHYIKLYNNAYRNWSRTPNAIQARYEHAMEHPDDVMDALALMLGVERKPLDPVRKIVRPGGTLVGTFDKSYYTEARFMHKLKDEEVAAVTNTVDWKLFGEMGYAERSK